MTYIQEHIKRAERRQRMLIIQVLIILFLMLMTMIVWPEPQPQVDDLAPQQRAEVVSRWAE